ncbi:creatininase family protein [Nocardioides sp. GY 10127]|uniref:creatininase family protein n=1 Tax=Nocardioides sp. GY 10127 TaxID=2569762 RepID=UPI0010A7E523|nr:creatininase family protein [Nocardioides sp. GY 10127]TIC81926.1 creatininase family protein [Nocardioides sp. GY 10127]
MTRKFAELSGPQTLERLTADSVLVVPIGAVEHHGPHLPLITDALVAESVVSSLVPMAVEAGIDAWQMPTLTIGKSDEHHWASGTLWLDAKTLFDTLVDLGRSVATTPARKIVFVNGHGGNTALLGVTNRELRRRFGLTTFSMPAGRGRAGTGRDGEPDEQGLGIHGGWFETSMIMHLRPDLVDESLFAPNVPEQFAGLTQIGFNSMPVSFGWLSDDFGPSGIVGDPTGATAEAGKEIFEHSLEQGLVALKEIDTFTMPARPVLG